MRVIAGLFRGRRLVSAPAGVRPTGDRVRERLFAVLAPRLEGARIFDLFCGTGTLGIEALSRGAASALFVDTSRQSLAALERNLAPLREAEPDLLMKSHRSAVDLFLSRPWPGGPPDGIFMDPPYGDPAGGAALAMLGLRLADEGRPVWIAHEGDRAELALPGELRLERVLHFGDTHVTLLQGGDAT